MATRGLGKRIRARRLPPEPHLLGSKSIGPQPEISGHKGLAVAEAEVEAISSSKPVERVAMVIPLALNPLDPAVGRAVATIPKGDGAYLLYFSR